MQFRAVLFDVGGPIDTEVAAEQMIDQAIRAALAEEGRPVTESEYEAANRRAVESFAWNAYQAIVWNLARPDVGLCERAFHRYRARAQGRPFELRDGIPGLLQSLHTRGVLLGLAANQPLTALDRLEEHGIGRYFHHREVSATHGFHKPDPRLFLRACESLGVAPHECVMVGDRIDNDVVPARSLGMYTVLFRTGRHINQQPRSWLEIPEAEVWDVPGLALALDRCLPPVATGEQQTAVP